MLVNARLDATGAPSALKAMTMGPLPSPVPVTMRVTPLLKPGA